MPLNANISAFLTMIAISEGTEGIGQMGYNCIVGGELFHDYSRHPDVLVTLNKRGLKSTAAGRYQFLYSTWCGLQKALNLPDFSPASQDAAAIQLIRESGALADVNTGRFDAAVAKCAHIWASLDGSPYGQHTNTLSQLRQWYVEAGGTLQG